MADAYLGAAMVKAAGNVQKHRAGKPERDARLAEAKARQSKAEEFSAAQPLRQSKQDVELEETQQQLRALQANAAKTATFAGFKAYEGDRDAKHLNTALASLKTNPVSGAAYADVVRLDSITRTPKTEAMLSRQGITDIDGFFDTPEESNNFVLATGANGEQSLVDLDKMYAATGFTRHMDETEIGNMQARNRRSQLATAGMLYKDMTAMERSARAVQKELGIPYNEALQMVSKSKKSTGSSVLERVADGLQEKDPSMAREDALRKAVELTRTSRGSALERETERIMATSPGMSNEEAMTQAKKNVQPSTSAQKNLQGAEVVREQLNELDVFNADLNDPKTRRQIGPKITELEKLTGKSLSAEDKRLTRQYRELTMLGDVSTELTDSQTGILDNFLHGVQQYMSNNVSGMQATTAYETIRNAVRHDLFGATLPAGEIAAFNKSMGSLGKQTGPVMEQLALSMRAVKNKLQSVYDMNDEMIAEYYVGRSLEDIDRVIENIDKRLESVSKQGKLTIKDVQTVPPQGAFQKLEPAAKKQRLDELFKGSDF